MEGTREILTSNTELPRDFVKNSRITTRAAFSAMVESSKTSRSCDVALMTEIDRCSSARYNKHLWCLVSPDFTIHKSIGSSEAIMSVSKPHFYHQKDCSAQACCWKSAIDREILVLCRSHSGSEAKESGCFEIYREKFCDTGLNSDQRFLVSSSELTLDRDESINHMFFIPDQIETVCRTDDINSSLPKTSAIPCTLVLLLSNLGKVFLWKISNSDDHGSFRPMKQDGALLVLSMLEAVPESQHILSCVQVSTNAILSMTETHLALITVDARSSIDFCVQELSITPEKSLPMSIAPIIHPNHSKSPQPSNAIAEITYFEQVDATTTNFVIGRVDKNIAVATNVLPLSSPKHLINGFSIHPFQDSKKAVIITESELAVYCCRFGGLKVFSMSLTHALWAAWVPSISEKLYTICVWNVDDKEELSCDFITLRNTDGSSLLKKTSIAHAINTSSSTTGHPTTDAFLDTEEKLLEHTDSFIALSKSYEDLKDVLRRFHHDLGDSGKTNIHAFGNTNEMWNQVIHQVKVVEKTLREFVKSDGHTLQDQNYRESENANAMQTLRRIRQMVHFLRYQAIHSKTLQKKLTVLRLLRANGEHVSPEVKAAQFVVMDGQYPRRTIESTDYAPWPLRPPHTNSE